MVFAFAGDSTTTNAFAIDSSTRCSLLVARCSSFATRCSLLVARCSSFATRCSRHVAHEQPASRNERHLCTLARTVTPNELSSTDARNGAGQFELEQSR